MAARYLIYRNGGSFIIIIIIGFSSSRTGDLIEGEKKNAKREGINYGFGTQAIHVGSEPNYETGAVIPPIYLTTTYKQHRNPLVRTFINNTLQGYEYSRSGNPNRNAFETPLASLESGGAHALAFASGSATTATVLQALGPNAHIVSVNDVRFGT